MKRLQAATNDLSTNLFSEELLSRGLRDFIGELSPARIS